MGYGYGVVESMETTMITISKVKQTRMDVCVSGILKQQH